MWQTEEKKHWIVFRLTGNGVTSMRMRNSRVPTNAANGLKFLYFLFHFYSICVFLFIFVCNVCSFAHIPTVINQISPQFILSFHAFIVPFLVLLYFYNSFCFAHFYWCRCFVLHEKKNFFWHSAACTFCLQSNFRLEFRFAPLFISIFSCWHKTTYWMGVIWIKTRSN